MTSWRNLRRSSRFPENGVGGRNFLVSDELGSFGADPAIVVVISCSSSESVSVSMSVSVSVKRDSSSLNSGEP